MSVDEVARLHARNNDIVQQILVNNAAIYAEPGVQRVAALNAENATLRAEHIANRKRLLVLPHPRDDEAKAEVSRAKFLRPTHDADMGLAKFLQPMEGAPPFPSLSSRAPTRPYIGPSYGRAYFEYDWEGHELRDAVIRGTGLVIHEGAQKVVASKVFEKRPGFEVNMRLPVPTGKVHFFVNGMDRFANPFDYSVFRVEVVADITGRRYKPELTTEVVNGRRMGCFVLEGVVRAGGGGGGGGGGGAMPPPSMPPRAISTRSLGGGGAMPPPSVPPPAMPPRAIPTRSLRIDGKMHRRLFPDFPTGMEARCAGKVQPVVLFGHTTDDELGFSAIFRDIPYDDLSRDHLLRVEFVQRFDANCMNNENTYDVTAAVANHDIEDELMTRVSVALITVEGTASTYQVRIVTERSPPDAGAAK